MTKRSHKNRKSRLTARERAKKWLDRVVQSAPVHMEVSLTRLLEAHAAATLARAKRRAGR